MQGFDYERLRQARPEDDDLLDPDLLDSDAYAHWYIGDYVRLLADFVESYNIDYPFTDERDVAVLSVKDDLMRARTSCDLPSRNLLYFSDEVGSGVVREDLASGETQVLGWRRGGCRARVLADCTPRPGHPEDCQEVDNCVRVIRNDPLSAFCSGSFCYGLDSENLSLLGLDKPHQAELIQDVPVGTDDGTRLTSTGRFGARWSSEHAQGGWENTGYYEQVVSGVPSGDYVLTWYARAPRKNDGTPFPQVAYRVEVLETVVPEEEDEPRRHTWSGLPSSSWERVGADPSGQRLMFHLDAGQDLKVRIHPSDADDTWETGRAAQFGAVWIWGVQLERVYCSDENCSGVEADPYQANLDSLLYTAPACPDLDGAVMRSQFEYRCVCLGFASGVCPEGSEGAPYRKCFWEYPFELPLRRIERGDLIPSNNIAIGNFNYRHEALAINVVGTNVIDCSDPTQPSSCYTNAFLPFTLEHSGWVEVRNHDRARMEYSMPVARVEHGKGLTAEVVLTNPLTSTHSGLLTEYWKDGLRGRPLQGQYMLRIWDTDNLVWDNVEDLQIVLKYRYWTQMSGY